MISKLSDEAALDFLMTSDFDENLTPKELKEMLLKYRYFYRLLHGRMEISTGDVQFEMQRLRGVVDEQQRQITNLQVQCLQKDEQIESLRSRKLTMKERIYGKIINEDEDKRL